MTTEETGAVAPVTPPLCRWSGPLDDDRPGLYVCDQTEDSLAHRHSLECPPQPAGWWACHTFEPPVADSLHATFDVVYDAQVRGIKRWQAAHPDHGELTWPDHSELVEWLLEQLAAYSLGMRARAPKAMREQHAGYHVDEGRWLKPAGDAEVWCVAPCHRDGGRCDGECDPECRRCPQECLMPECVAASAAISVRLRRDFQLRQAGAQAVRVDPIEPEVAPAGIAIARAILATYPMPVPMDRDDDEDLAEAYVLDPVDMDAIRLALGEPETPEPTRSDLLGAIHVHRSDLDTVFRVATGKVGADASARVYVRDRLLRSMSAVVAKLPAFPLREGQDHG